MIACAAALAALLAANTVRAEGGYGGGAAARTLEGHRFQPPVLLEGPFTTSHVGIDTSMGLRVQDGAFATPTAPLRLPLPARDGQTLFLFEERLAVGIAPVRGAEIGARAAFQMTVGGDPASTYFYGGRTGYDVRPHLGFEVLHSEVLGLSVGLRAGLIMAGGVRARPSGLVDAMMREADAAMRDPARIRCLRAGDLGCAFTTFDGAGALRVDERSFGVHARASVAKSFGQHVGMQASFGGEALDTRLHGGPNLDARMAPRAYGASVAASVDLAPIAPVGAMLEAGLERGENRGLDRPNADLLGGAPMAYTTERVAAGVYYTGRDALTLGFVGTYGFTQERRAAGDTTTPRPPARALGGRLAFRYFF
ncbi:hypothetical protein [Polyangium sp. 6x1]|uniref:hypothetical protein n=1 Tax=Polyangium sp. 6x1 TaxID=3042689 RepID=UPI0024831EE1|nr:hypothetical protein [Polyangium sp. 6x1]MDI1444733.1 hypothetical protein [Polyangium sp. 6x1]